MNSVCFSSNETYLLIVIRFEIETEVEIICPSCAPRQVQVLNDCSNAMQICSQAKSLILGSSLIFSSIDHSCTYLYSVMRNTYKDIPSPNRPHWEPLVQHHQSQSPLCHE